MSSSSVPSRVMILTGATGAIGGAIALSLASATPHVCLLLTARTSSAAEKLVSNLRAQSNNPNIFYEVVDLASKKSVTSFAETLGKKYGGKVNVLVNNAAIVTERRELTGDGIETMFQVNVLSYYLLSKLLRPYLKAGSTPSNLSRIVNVASNYAGDLDLQDLQFTQHGFDSTTAYRQSKQANRMLTYHLAAAFVKDGITVNACHPGVVTSNLLRMTGLSHGFNSPEEAAATPVFLATSTTVEGKTAGFYSGKNSGYCQFKSDTKEIEQLAAVCDKLLE